MKNPLYLKVLIDSDLDPLEIDNLKSEIEGLVGVLEVEKAAQQSAQADSKRRSEFWECPRCHDLHDAEVNGCGCGYSH